MSDLLSGMEKYGFKDVNLDSIFEDDKPKTVARTAEEKTVEAPKEEDFLLDKGVRCPICDTVFKSRMVKSGRARRLESDRDLRPRFEYIDTIKYDVSSCPKCGYTAINRYFPHLSSAQMKLIREEVCTKFKPEKGMADKLSYTYDEAIERYKLALINTIAKKGKASEKAYECLKISWLYRGKKEEIQAANSNPSEEVKAEILKCEQTETAFYTQALDGFLKAMTSESYPMCGMEQNTVDFLIANMAFNLKRYDLASKFVSALLVSKTTSKTIKDKALTLKEEIISEIKNGQ